MKLIKNGKLLKTLCLLAVSACLLIAPGTVLAGGGTLSAEIGQGAPDFTSLSTTGRAFTLSEQTGSTVLLTFWSDWCSLEKTELEFLSSVKERYPDVHIVIVDSESHKPTIRTLSLIRRSLEEWGIEASVIVDKGLKVTSLYEVEALPTSLVIDPTGRIVHRQPNFFKGADDEVTASLDRVYSISMLK
jgi:peroxiredoxin